MTWQVTGMSLKKREPSKNGAILRAYFDAHNPDIGFKGCALIEKPNGGFSVSAPRLEGGAGRKFGDQIAVYFRRESRLREELTEAALASYRALAGATDTDEPGALGDELAEEIAA